ncbi:modulator of drug activity B [Amphibacillus marinus]|uniref:Modulator of drug activity B n=1 Tax=Amphibacillus marinus TaxID=872970 RepID=A0A1H8MDK7_9BACI|nr:NAD(P)H-dependent oxidoreductase [Amphibacillus marinus]SEO15298.1 modulator of drug activity B [Amphibacillus marinus]
MKRILIINGHEWYPNSQGRLNEKLTNHIKKRLAGSYELKETIIDQGYLIEEEQEKYKWADCIIYQTPIFWFSIPGKLKTYFDRVIKSGVCFEQSEQYGRGGLFKDKHYMLSTTWSAPADQFNSHGGFFEGKSLDDVLFPLHRTHAFIGMKPLKTFSLHRVAKQPELPEWLTYLDIHLQEVFDLPKQKQQAPNIL